MDPLGFRKKEIPFSDISKIHIAAFGKKAFLVIKHAEKFELVSNSLARFAEMVRSLADKATPEQLGEGVEEFLENPRNNYKDIIISWMAVAIFLLVLILKLEIIG